MANSQHPVNNHKLVRLSFLNLTGWFIWAFRSDFLLSEPEKGNVWMDQSREVILKVGSAVIGKPRSSWCTQTQCQGLIATSSCYLWQEWDSQLSRAVTNLKYCLLFNVSTKMTMTTVLFSLLHLLWSWCRSSGPRTNYINIVNPWHKIHAFSSQESEWRQWCRKMGKSLVQSEDNYSPITNSVN